MRIYILSTYNEYGSENVEATSDIKKLFEIFGRKFDDLTDRSQPQGIFESERAKLELLINSGLHYVDGQDLGEGYGGIQLHIVELQ